MEINANGNLNEINDNETENIECKLKEIFKDNINLQVPVEQINLEDTLVTLGIDSISFIKIIVSVETEFGIEFNDEDLDFNKFPDISSFVSYVRSKVRESPK